jgi:hypothetical protein
MNYELVWPDALINRLTTFYLDARARRLGFEFTQATTAIEARLQTSPSNAGESRDDDDRVIVVPPLSVTYRIVEESKQVYIRSLGYSLDR